jgi:peptidoglycan biosynthesis protein MviN/MurJ (putative lipid II flippase)
VAALVANAVASLALIGALPAHQASRLASAIAAIAAPLHVADLGHVGLALAASLAAAVNVAFLIAPLARRVGGLDLRPPLVALLRSLVAAVPMALLVHVAAGRVDWTAPGGAVFKALWLAAIIAAGLIAFVGAALVIGGAEVDGVRKLVVERLRRGGRRRSAK